MHPLADHPDADRADDAARGVRDQHTLIRVANAAREPLPFDRMGFSLSYGPPVEGLVGTVALDEQGRYRRDVPGRGGLDRHLRCLA